MKHVRWTVIAWVAAACGTTQAPADTVQFDPVSPAGALQTDAAVQAPADASSGEFLPSPIVVDAGGTPADGSAAPGDAPADGGASADAGEPGAGDAGRADAGDVGGADAGTDAGRADAGPPPPPPPDDDDD